MLSADFGAHIALGWGQPARAICPYVEFRHLTNDARIRSGDREKGFYSLAGALRYFGDDGIDCAQKDDIRDRIIAGPAFSAEERQIILSYCRNDVMAFRLIKHIVPTIRSLPHAFMRAQFMWATAQQEHRGVPLDLPLLGRIRSRLPRQGDTEILPILQHLASGNFPEVFLDLSLGEFRPLAFLSGASLCLQ